jgi:8-oxo-dGTP pyrophosphatase MutT (NUDIX family)
VVVRVFAVTPHAVRQRIVRHLTPNFTAGVVTLLVRPNGDVLFVRMTYRKGWGLPGGLLGRGETPERTAQREIEEEVGLRIDEPVLYRTWVSPQLQTITFFTIAGVTDEQVAGMRCDPIEVASVAWFSPTAMPVLDDEIAPMHEADRRAVMELMKNGRR